MLLIGTSVLRPLPNLIEAKTIGKAYIELLCNFINGRVKHFLNFLSFFLLWFIFLGGRNVTEIIIVLLVNLMVKMLPITLKYKASTILIEKRF